MAAFFLVSGVVILLAIWLVTKLFWPLLAVLTAVGAVYLGVTLLRQQTATQRQEDAENAQLAQRADEQDALFLSGDTAGMYGLYTPDVAGPEAAIDQEGRRPLPGPKPTLQAAVEDQDFHAEQVAIAKAGTAARGRVLIDQFVATMKKHGIPPETIFEESRGPHRWSYEKIVGNGWMLQDLGNDRSHFRYHYIIPGKGIAEVVDRLPERTIVKVLRYGTTPDDSDRAYTDWSGRASLLAHQTRELTNGKRK